jgi:hypothetical protein
LDPGVDTLGFFLLPFSEMPMYATLLSFA